MQPRNFLESLIPDTTPYKFATLSLLQLITSSSRLRLRVFSLSQVMDRTHEIHADGPKGTICEKIRRSLAIRPAKQPFNQVSYIQQVPKPSSAPSRNMYENRRGNGGVVPIEFDRSAFRNGKHGNGHIVVEGKPKPQFIGKNTDTETKMNDTFSDYINHAKMKISRTGSDVGARGVARLDSVNKRASAYIDRARQKIRNSATFRAGTFQKK